MEKKNQYSLEKYKGYLPLLVATIIILIGLNFLQAYSFAWKFSWIGLVSLAGGVLAREVGDVHPTYGGVLVGVLCFIGMRFLYEGDIFLPIFAFIMASTGAEYMDGLKAWRGRTFMQKVFIPAILTPVAGFILFPFAFSMALNSAEKTPSPELSFVTIDNDPILPADLAGKVVVLDFWGTWCGPCLAAFPDMEKLYASYQENEEVAFWFVNTLGNGDTPQKIQTFLARKEYGLPMAMDTYGIQGKLDITSIPHTLLIDKEGNIRFRHVGFFPGENLPATLGEKIDQLLAE
ncbi:MAG: TlpA disulfide reductase family protein [Bacteroidota bacterium]